MEKKNPRFDFQSFYHVSNEIQPSYSGHPAIKHPCSWLTTLVGFSSLALLSALQAPQQNSFSLLSLHNLCVSLPNQSQVPASKHQSQLFSLAGLAATIACSVTDWMFFSSVLYSHRNLSSWHNLQITWSLGEIGFPPLRFCAKAQAHGENLGVGIKVEN